MSWSLTICSTTARRPSELLGVPGCLYLHSPVDADDRQGTQVPAGRGYHFLIRRCSIKRGLQCQEVSGLLTDVAAWVADRIVIVREVDVAASSVADEDRDAPAYRGSARGRYEDLLVKSKWRMALPKLRKIHFDIVGNFGLKIDCYRTRIVSAPPALAKVPSGKSINTGVVYGARTFQHPGTVRRA